MTTKHEAKKPKKSPRPTRLRRNPKEKAVSPMHTKLVYDLSEAAEKLNISYNTLKARIRKGRIDLNMDGPPKRDKLGRLSLRGAQITAEEIDRHLASRSVRIAHAS